MHTNGGAPVDESDPGPVDASVSAVSVVSTEPDVESTLDDGFEVEAVPDVEVVLLELDAPVSSLELGAGPHAVPSQRIHDRRRVQRPTDIRALYQSPVPRDVFSSMPLRPKRLANTAATLDHDTSRAASPTME